MGETQTIFVDIDGTICTSVLNAQYYDAEPIEGMINYVNKLFDAGHTIIYWTARGTTTGLDWLTFTKSQLDKWGVKYHDVKVGKPYYDVFIDDKSINPSNIKTNE